MAFVIDYPDIGTSLRLPGVDPNFNLIVSQAGSTTAVATLVTDHSIERYMPYYWGGGRFDSISIYVSSATTSPSNMRLALYRSDGGNGLPGSLVVDAGEVASNSTGMKTANITEQYLTPGWYYTWFIMSDPGDASTATVKAQGISVCGVTPLGCYEMIAASHATKAGTYGPAPTTASTGLTSNVDNRPLLALGKV